MSVVVGNTSTLAALRPEVDDVMLLIGDLLSS